MFFWEIYEIFRTGFTRNTNECKLLQLVVAGKCFDQNIFFKKMSHSIWYSMTCIIEVSRPFTMLMLVCTGFVWFTSVRALFWTSGNGLSIVSIKHILLFFLNKNLQGRVALVAQERINVCETVGRKSNCKISFQCTSFELTKKHICLLKIVDTSFKHFVLFTSEGEMKSWK